MHPSGEPTCNRLINRFLFFVIVFGFRWTCQVRRRASYYVQTIIIPMLIISALPMGGFAYDVEVSKAREGRNPHASSLYYIYITNCAPVLFPLLPD